MGKERCKERKGLLMLDAYGEGKKSLYVLLID